MPRWYDLRLLCNQLGVSMSTRLRIYDLIFVSALLMPAVRPAPATEIEER